jgi:hypothetical protein
MKFKQFKQSQKFRVIVKGVSVYVTAKQIRWGFGDQLTTNAAVHAAFHSLTNMKAAGEPNRHVVKIQLDEHTIFSYNTRIV